MNVMSATDVLMAHIDKFHSAGGGQAVGLCPFHSEKTPSFRVNIDPSSPNFLMWICNGCGRRGGGRKLLLQLLGESQAGLIDELLPKLQIQHPCISKLRKKQVHYLPEAVTVLYSGYVLNSLEAAGFTREVLDRYEVGYDESRRAFTYPIRDIDSRLVGIYRRNPDEAGKKNAAKYMPYGPNDFPENLVPPGYAFVKGEHLWGIHLEVHRTGLPVVVVEGFKAAMWLHQYIGQRYRIVAALGTAFSPRQIQLLGSMGSPMTRFLFDNRPDAARLARTAAQAVRDEGYPATALTEYPLQVPQPDDIPHTELETLFP